MLNSFKRPILMAVFVLTAWNMAGFLFAQPVVVGPVSPLPYAQLPYIPPLDCGETKVLVTNTTNQPRSVDVEIKDCCDRFDSLLYINAVHHIINYVPDAGLLCTSVVLQPGDRLILDCNGNGDGDCQVKFKETCNECP